MGFISEERQSGSPYIESVARGRSVLPGYSLRPAVCQWHMVLLRYRNIQRMIVSGPWTAAGPITYGGDAELLWIRFRLGVFMPHWPARDLLDRETALPEAARASFRLDGDTWQFPDYEHVETFAGRLGRAGILARDPLVAAALDDDEPAWSPRTARDRFLRATGLTRGHIRQVARAQRARALLEGGAAITDTVYQAGYYDQPHLTRALRRWTGRTPTQLARSSISA
jgi:AraC-like DNA-binding protein